MKGLVINLLCNSKKQNAATFNTPKPCVHDVYLTRSRQSELAAFILAEEVIVEKIHIQGRLQNSTCINHPIVLVVGFVVRPIDPIHNVQRAVST